MSYVENRTQARAGGSDDVVVENRTQARAGGSDDVVVENRTQARAGGSDDVVVVMQSTIVEVALSPRSRIG
jgi:hypothetical protein